MQELLMLLRQMFANPLHNIVLGSLFFLAVGISFLSALFEALEIRWLPNFLQNIGAGMLGSLITFFLIDRFLGEGVELQQIYRDLQSKNNLVARAAIEKAREKGILMDGSMHRQIFFGPNWEDADLSDAILTSVSLNGTNLKGANLQGANIAGAHLSAAQFNEQTILPDGTHWTSDTDLERFTRPKK